MALGKRKRDEQSLFWIATTALPQSGGHPSVGRPKVASIFATLLKRSIQLYSGRFFDPPSSRKSRS